jgi:hypothetical protein
MQSSYSSRMRRATWLAFGAPAAIGAVLGFFLRGIGPGQHFWLVFPILLVGCALALWACVPWWRRMDDMQKHGHMVSWYWGGLAGGIIMLMAIIAANGTRSEQALGALLVMMGSVGGFLLFWAMWAWRRRGDPS